MKFNMKQRLMENSSRKVTTLKVGKLELISGDSTGYISIFWLETGEKIQQCKAHEASVINLAFDSTKLVTCGMDCCLKVIDITSCQILHTLRDFEQPVASLRFDSGTRITTLSKDGLLKYWLWEKNSGESGGNQGDGYLYHTVSDGETISTICKLYGLTFADMIKLNDKGALDNKNIRAGLKLIVGNSKNIKRPSSRGEHTAGEGRDSKQCGGYGAVYHFRNNRASIDTASTLDPNVKEEETEVTHDIKSEPTSLSSRLEKASEGK
jgi:hypothetical protein